MKQFVILLVLSTACGATPLLAEEPNFRVHEIGKPGGVNFGQTSAVDIDRDGDLDFVSGRRFGDVFWFENRGAGRWPQHLLGEKALTDVGGVAFDVDGDGWGDQVSGGTWYRNPGRSLQTHESVCGVVDGDGDIDILTKPWNGDLHRLVENLLWAAPSAAKP